MSKRNYYVINNKGEVAGQELSELSAQDCLDEMIKKCPDEGWEIMQDDEEDEILKWCIVDEKGNDQFVQICESREEALQTADKEWDRMTEYDKKKRNSYIVGLYEVDEYGDIDNLIEIAKEFC